MGRARPGPALALAVGLRFSASVVAGDDFYRDMPEEQRWTLTAAQGVAEYFDWQRLRHELLEPLRAGRAARYRPFSWRPEGGLDDRVVTVDPAPIVVLEGIYAARPELRDLVDLAVLVETPADERHRQAVSVREVAEMVAKSQLKQRSLRLHARF